MLQQQNLRTDMIFLYSNILLVLFFVFFQAGIKENERYETKKKKKPRKEQFSDMFRKTVM